MAFSVSTDRSRPQESPMLWLSVLAGSLVLHLALLLLGRWYLSQTASAPAGIAQAPLDFVEIDPNAPVLKQPVTPSNTPTQTTPKVAPPQTAPVEPAQSPSSIENLTPQFTPERPRTRINPSPSPAPTTPASQPSRSQPGQLPSDQTTPQRNSTAPPTTRPTTNPTTNPGGTNPSQPSSPPDSSTPGTTTPPGSTSPTQPETPSDANAGNPSSPPAGNPNAPVSGGEPLSIATNLRGEVYGTINEVSYRPEQYARGTVSLKSSAPTESSFDYPSKLPVDVLDLQLGLRITGKGEIVDVEVLDESPSLQENPKLKEKDVRQDIQSIANGFVLKANAEGSLAFNVNLDSSGRDAYRIMNIRIFIKQ
ncbi:MAG: hypothetical protein KME18_24805 [Phormidium tanganyikae FI6-MK23]|nr:hypothetical protein [Phormidium tanganyikae FI6-MK23]